MQTTKPIQEESRSLNKNQKSTSENLDDFVEDLLDSSYQQREVNKNKSKKSKPPRDLDPMDPSAYSDVPR